MNDLGSREPSRRYELLELSVISTILSQEPMALNAMNNLALRMRWTTLHHEHWSQDAMNN